MSVVRNLRKEALVGKVSGRGRVIWRAAPFVDRMALRGSAKRAATGGPVVEHSVHLKRAETERMLIPTNKLGPHVGSVRSLDSEFAATGSPT